MAGKKDFVTKAFPQEKKSRSHVGFWVFSISLLIVMFVLGRMFASHRAADAQLETDTTTDSAESIVEETTKEPLCDKNGNQITIVLDAGHGGEDPGKVGVHNELEKDINLSIVLQLKERLTEEGIRVVLTRENDRVYTGEGNTSKKVADLKNRIQVMKDTDPVFAISIHQNSYTEPSVSGPQVFYHKDSVVGEELATVLQNNLIEDLNPAKKREIKSNGSYYLLKKTTVPLVIVECGFLSNEEEASLLATEEYQKKIVDSICKGVLSYLISAHIVL